MFKKYITVEKSLPYGILKVVNDIGRHAGVESVLRMVNTVGYIGRKTLKSAIKQAQTLVGYINIRPFKREYIYIST